MKPGTDERHYLERLKIACLSTGIKVEVATLDRLRQLGPDTLTVHEYPTTGGITLELPGQVYVNAPFDDWFCNRARAALEFAGDDLIVAFDGRSVPVVRFLPLPGYLDRMDSQGRPVTDVVMSHGDRARLSPLVGCIYDCQFCDLPSMRYRLREADQLLAALDVAARDTVLPVRHLLISGGSPKAADYEVFEQVVGEVVRGAGMPVDIMMSPMVRNTGFVDRMVDAGVTGFSINLEVFSPEPSVQVLGKKYRVTRRVFAEFVTRAVERLGSGPNVRSLIIPGLEPVESTLAGVEFLTSLGCTPVISPFRPGQGTELARHEPVPESMLIDVLAGARDIAASAGLGLGPDCLPCQHNTLTFPWDTASAWSADGHPVGARSSPS